MKEEKKFVCAYCGSPYDTPVERARCENSCWEEQQKNKAMEKAIQLQKDKLNRKNEIDNEYKKLLELIKKYKADYNERYIIRDFNISFNGCVDDLFNNFFKNGRKLN